MVEQYTNDNSECRIEHILNLAVEDFEDRLKMQLFGIGDDEGVRGDSEIEKMIAAVVIAKSLGAFPSEFKFEMQCLPECKSVYGLKDFNFEDNIISVFQQINMGEYRLDFLFGTRVSFLNKDGDVILAARRLLALECDGHDFHERTKEQAARDKKRCRKILSHGIPTMRFTGSEIWADAVECIEEVNTYFCQLSERAHASAFAFWPGRCGSDGKLL